MPDLGRYAAEVLGAYAVSLGLLAGIVWISIVQHRRAKADLEAAEKRWRDG